MNAIDWIDLPDVNYVAVLGYETKNVLELNELIQKYSRIPKDKIETLSCRIKKLDKIVFLIKEWVDTRLDSIDKKKHLLWISEIALKKRNYLNELLVIYENNLHEDQYQIAQHNDLSDLYDQSKNPVILNNHRFFSLKLREYWGDFWFESLDPCHRRLTPFLDQWRTLQKSNPETPHFFLWLETQHIPKYVPCVKYLKGNELEKLRVVIKDGLFWEKTDSEWSLANFNNQLKRYLFSISLKGEIFVSEESEGISHSSFTSGKPVLGAGLLHINKGMITSIALESGHYMPSIEIGYQIVKFFEEKGATFPEKLQIIFFCDRNKYKTEFAANPLPNLESFKEILRTAVTCMQRGCNESNTK